MRKFFGMLLSITMLGVIAVGCGSKVVESNKLVKPGAENSEEDDDGLITIGFSQVGAESDWRVANTKSMKETLSEENGFKLIFADAQQKKENQIKAVRDFISQEVDVIVIAPVTEKGWETVLGEAKDVGIPVIIVDRMIEVSDDSLFKCWIGSDFYHQGVKAVKWLVDYMQSIGRGDEQLNVVVLQGTMGSTAEIGRTKSVRDELAKHSNYKIIAEQGGEFTQAKGQEVMESFLKTGQKIDIVISQNDNMSFGVIDALKAAGKVPGKDVIIVSFDAVKAAFVSMIAGEMNVSVECNPLHGPRVAEVVKAITEGREVEKIQYVEEGIYPADRAAESIAQRRY